MLENDAVIRMASLHNRSLGHSQWIEAFWAVRRAKEKDSEVEESVLPQLTDNGLFLLKLIENDFEKGFCVAWETLPRHEKAEHWKSLALWLIRNSPRLALEFLSVTARGSERANFSMVSDCMNYLGRYHREELADGQDGSRTFQSFIETCLDPELWPVLNLAQAGARLYVQSASYDAVCRAFDIVRERGIVISAETALCFMYRFTEFNDVDRSLDALRFIPRIEQPGFEVNSEGVIRHCCKLLTLDSVEEVDGVRNFRILPRILEMGIVPSQIMMNVVLSNALQTGDPQLGLDVLDFMKSQGHEFDSYTYVALLCDAVAREDRGRVVELVHEMEKTRDWRLQTHIASKVMHAHFVFEAKRMDPNANPTDIFYSMLRVYNELHDLKSLKELGIIPQNFQMPSTRPSDRPKIPPSPMAIYMMIATYFRCQRRIAIVRLVYKSFRDLVAAGHEYIAPLAETDHTYNEFLMAYRNDARGLQDSIHVVEDMLRPYPPMKIHHADGEERDLKHVQPTVRTWTILLSVFTFNRQPRAAEKVKEMMEKRSVKYNQATWNIIVNSFVNMQDIPKAAESIKTMETEGFKIDTYLMNSLRYLHEPERLWIALEELDEIAEQEARLLKTTKDPEGESSEQRNDELLEQGLRRLGEKPRG